MYKKFKPISPLPAVAPVPTYDEVVTPILVDGVQRSEITRVLRTENPNKDFKAIDFEISSILATGNTDLLKKVPLMSCSDLAAADNVTNHADYMVSLPTESAPTESAD